MHVDARKIAVCGSLMAVTVVLVVFGGILESNTLFLLAAASFCIGIIIKEYGLKSGVAFFIGSTVLSFLLAPQKLHCVTFGMMGGYLVLVETVFGLLGRYPNVTHRREIFIISKFLIFNLLYLPAVFVAPKLFFAGKMAQKAKLILIIGGQVALFIYDKAYEYFLTQIWEKLSDKLLRKRN